MSKRKVTLEGFLSVKDTGDDCFYAFLMRPYVRMDMPTSAYVSSLIEDVGIDMSLGDPDEDHDEREDNHMPVLDGCFYRARKAFERGDWKHVNQYFKVVLEVDTDPDSPLVFTIGEVVGHPDLVRDIERMR